MNSCHWCSSPLRPALEAGVASGRTVADMTRSLDQAGRYQSAVRHCRMHVAHPAAGGEAIALDPVAVFEGATGHEPMEWQVRYLRETRSLVLRKGRQVGATEAAASLAIATALSDPGADVVLIAPSQRQSGEIIARARVGLYRLDKKLQQDSTGLIRLPSGSRIIGLPGNSRGIRGYAPALCILDEASWIMADTFAASRPLVAASGGRLIAQSTPGVAAGWFHDLATSTPEGWASMVVRSDEVPTISPDFIRRERAEMAAGLFAQEYLAEYDADHGASARPIATLERLASLTDDREAPFVPQTKEV